MKPITTVKELKEMEALIRHSERLRVACWLRDQREMTNTVQVFDVLAQAIQNGDHWRKQ